MQFRRVRKKRTESGSNEKDRRSYRANVRVRSRATNCECWKMAGMGKVRKRQTLGVGERKKRSLTIGEIQSLGE